MKPKIKKKPRYDHIAKLYASFTNKDMTLEEFRKAYLAELDPSKMKRDIGQILHTRDKSRTQAMVAKHQKQQIDNKLAEG